MYLDNLIISQVVHPQDEVPKELRQWTANVVDLSVSIYLKLDLNRVWRFVHSSSL